MYFPFQFCIFTLIELEIKNRMWNNFAILKRRKMVKIYLNYCVFYLFHIQTIKYSHYSLIIAPNI